MNEIRSYASLSGSLLARKGGARPAMRPQPLATGPITDDLGWDDFGEAEPYTPEHVPSSIAALTPAPKPAAPAAVHVQQQALSEHFGPAEAAEAPEAAPAVVTAIRARGGKRKRAPRELAPGKKAAFTLRLDADRHLRLRLASAVTGQSAQQLVTGALDSFLETLPEVSALARNLPVRAGAGS